MFSSIQVYSPCKPCKGAGFDAHKGFSLLEMLVLTAIVGILIAIAAPAWAAFLNVRNLNAAQDEALQIIRQAQSEAERHRVDWRASFRQVNDQVQARVHAATEPAMIGTWQDLSSSIRIDPDETTLSQSAGVYQIEFSHEGRVNGQLGRLTFMGASGGRARRCVVVSTLLGALRRAANRSRPDSSDRYCY